MARPTYCRCRWNSGFCPSAKHQPRAPPHREEQPHKPALAGSGLSRSLHTTSRPGTARRRQAHRWYYLWMAVHVARSDDPAWVLTNAKAFLASHPVLHNVILTLLQARVAHHEPGRYWVATDDDTAAGVVFQSPLNFPATLTPMKPQVVEATVEAISAAGVTLPGVNGEAATAARFAGQWAERQRAPATPFQGQRIYEVFQVQDHPMISGNFRKAVSDDRDQIVAFMRGFQSDTTENKTDVELFVDRRLPAGQFWIWDDSTVVSMATHSEPVQGVVRVQAVYTPPNKRNRGYATACVAALSKQIRNAGCRCILYTDLANPTSNSIYRRIGYCAVAEGLQYRFDS